MPHARTCTFCNKEVINAIENEEWVEVVREDTSTLRLVAKKIQLAGSDTFVNVAVVMQGWTRHLCRDDREHHVDENTITYPPSLADPPPPGQSVRLPKSLGDQA